MKRRPRIRYTQEQITLMWDRYQKGDSLIEIAASFDRYHTSISGIFHKTGGIRPAARKRSNLSLTLAEREEISRGLVAGLSFQALAQSLDRPLQPSVVS